MEKVKQFYNKTPFPDYELDRFNDKEDLDVYSWEFPRILDRSIRKGSVIDVGCGTSQLSAYLSLNKEVLGIDFSSSSLRKAKALKRKLKLNNLKLKEVDIMKPIKIKERFDYLLCLGVLHHTENAYQGFKNILPLLKDKGYIAIGLYNKTGRIPLKVRIFLAKTIFKNNKRIKDYFIKLQIGDVEDKERARGWWNDQYLHPHETTHNLGEVLRWFKKNNIEYYQCVPTLSNYDLEIAGVWNKERRPILIERIYYQITWLLKTHKEGGYFIVFGRKK